MKWSRIFIFIQYESTKQLEHLEVSLAKIQNYKKTGFDLISVLGIASDFLKTQLGDKPAPGAKPQVIFVNLVG